MSTTFVEDESREVSPDGNDVSADRRTSKKRKVLSCFACRNRKMKCDRVYPVCGRCQRTGRADQCTYDPRLLEDPQLNGEGNNDGGISLLGSAHAHSTSGSTGNTPQNELLWKIRMQERRIQTLEQQLASKEGKSNGPGQYEPASVEEPTIGEEVMFRGKDFKTQFHGLTSIMSLISKYRELQAFTHQALRVDHAIVKVKVDFKRFRARRKTASRDTEAQIRGTDEQIFALLPAKYVVDIQVALYFQTWETTYRILHEPTFWKEYHAFWDKKDNTRNQTGFAVILLLMIAATKCVDAKDDVFLGDSSADRDAASHLIDMADAWLNRQPRKRLTLMFFQLHCLALLAKRANCLKLKQDWITAGDLVRLALAAGMHRDPAMLGSGTVTAFDKEMKRRLWITIAEFELQSSLECGLPSSLTNLYFNTPPPANLPDDTILSDMRELPASRPVSHFTSASYLTVTSKSLPLRIHLASILNDPSNQLHYSDVLHYDAQIHAVLDALPSWDDDRARTAHALLELQLRQYLILLHKPYAKLARENRRFMHSFTAYIDVASSLLDIHDKLASADLLALNHFRNDVIRVGLGLSQVIYHNCFHTGAVQVSGPTPNRETAKTINDESHFENVPKKKWGLPDMSVMLAHLPEELMPRLLCTSALEILERTRELFERKVLRLGTGYMEFWLLTAAIGMLPSRFTSNSIVQASNDGDDLEARCRTTLDKFSTLTYRVLAMQKDPGNSLAVSLRDTMFSQSPSEGRTPSLATRSASGTTPATTGQGTFFTATGVDGEANLMSGSKDITGPFDALQDMAMDLSSWEFPDIWAFNVGGDLGGGL